MSLINDALKKAQRQQTGGAADPAPSVTPGGGTAPRIERREKPADFRSQVLVLGGVSAGLLLALIVGGFFWWRSSNSSETTKPQTVAQTTAPATKLADTASVKAEPKPEPAKVEPVKIEPVAAAPATATPAAAGTPQFTLPLAQPTSAPTAPAAATTASTSPAVQLPAATPSPEPVKAAPADRPKPSPQMVKAIEAFRVKSRRAAGADSKVLMNDRVYRIGDTVDIDLDIKLIDVAQDALTFEDSRGAVYKRNF